MKRLALAFLFSSFLGAGVALAGGGDFDMPQQQAAPQAKVIVNIPDNGNDWTVPVVVAVVGGLATIGAAWVARSRRKGD